MDWLEPITSFVSICRECCFTEWYSCIKFRLVNTKLALQKIINCYKWLRNNKWDHDSFTKSNLNCKMSFWYCYHEDNWYKRNNVENHCKGGDLSVMLWNEFRCSIIQAKRDKPKNFPNRNRLVITCNCETKVSICVALI